MGTRSMTTERTARSERHERDCTHCTHCTTLNKLKHAFSSSPLTIPLKKPSLRERGDWKLPDWANPESDTTTPVGIFDLHSIYRFLKPLAPQPIKREFLFEVEQCPV